MGSVQKIAVSRSRISRSRVNGMEKDFIPGTVIVHEGYYLAGSDSVYVAGNDGTYLAGKDNADVTLVPGVEDHRRSLDNLLPGCFRQVMYRDRRHSQCVAVLERNIKFEVEVAHVVPA